MRIVIICEKCLPSELVSRSSSRRSLFRFIEATKQKESAWMTNPHEVTRVGNAYNCERKIRISTEMGLSLQSPRLCTKVFCYCLSVSGCTNFPFFLNYLDFEACLARVPNNLPMSLSRDLLLTTVSASLLSSQHSASEPAESSDAKVEKRPKPYNKIMCLVGCTILLLHALPELLRLNKYTA